MEKQSKHRKFRRIAEELNVKIVHSGWLICIKQSLEATVKAWLDLVLPRNCLLCQHLIPRSSGLSDSICPVCYASLEPAPYPEQLSNDLLRNVSDDSLCIRFAIARFHAMRSDRDGILVALHALKYRGIETLGTELGRELGALLYFRRMNEYDLLVPVPVHAARARERGYNQAEAIARGIAQILTIEINTQLITRIRYTGSQTKLSNAERRRNVEGAFQLCAHPSLVFNKRILLVDDVLTTGSTLNSIAQLLLESGALFVDVATVVKAE